MTDIQIFYEGPIVNRAEAKRDGMKRYFTGKACKQNNKCAEPTCSVDLSDGYHVDHIMPLALGGSNWPENLQCLCPDCNRRKSDKHPLDWAKENGRLL